MEHIVGKRTIDAETSVARPSVASIAQPSYPNNPVALLTWRGNVNSEALSALAVSTDGGLTIVGSKNVIVMPDDESTAEASPFAPAMAAASPTSIVIAWIGTNPGRNLNVAKLAFKQGSSHPADSPPSSWAIYSKVVLPHTSFAAPALTVSPQAIYLAWTGSDAEHRINVMRSDDGGSVWYAGSGPVNHPSLLHAATSDDGPALAFADGELYLAWTNKNGAVCATTLDPEELAIYHPFVDISDETSHYGPTATAWRDQCVIGWTGTDAGDTGSLNTMRYESGTFATKRTFDESSVTGPTLAVVPPYYLLPGRLCFGWTGTDSSGKLNIGVIATEIVSG